MDGFIKLIRSQVAVDLACTDPNAFAVLSLVALRASRTGNPALGLKINEACMGASEFTGMSAQNYRTAKKHLITMGFVTDHTTNAGTVLRLSQCDFWDINSSLPTDQPTNTQQTRHKHVTTIKKERKKEGKKSNTPPTQCEVGNYMAERGVDNQAEAQSFVDFYESKGWMVGKNKMKSWKAAVRNWLKRSQENGRQHAPTATDFLNGRYSLRDTGDHVPESLSERLKRLGTERNDQTLGAATPRIPIIEN